MSVSDPDCGKCKTIKTPSGKDRDIHHRFPKALEHHYPLPALESTSIPVYRGNFDLNATRYRGVIAIELEPRPSLVAYGVREVTLPDGLDNFLGTREPAQWVDYDAIAIRTEKVPAPAKTSRPPNRPGTVGAVSTRAPHLAGIDVGESADLDQVTFYLFNGWYGLDGFNTCHDGHECRGRIDTTLGEWQLRIEPRGDIPPTVCVRHQRETGKSTVTHIGRIRRDDGGRFNAADAMEVLQVVETLAGFALGRVTAVVLPVGYRAGLATWARWKCNRAVDRPLGATPFLDQTHTAAQLTELFRAGYATSKDPLRWQVFQSALGYHYSAEHQATVSMKVMLPVSALQLISYAHLVQELQVGDPNYLTHRQWSDKSLGTIGQLRRLLSVVGVDMSVPKHFAQLVKVQADITDNALPAPDALDCVVRLRNRVAHPKQKDAKRWTTEGWAEAGFAATTMFNLAMLWWLGYDHRYLGKTLEYRGADQSTYVPWHKP
ncbi:MAG: hypothetical protein KJ817_11855 [Actinobacteria bacterium]|nr:hypothetical protein [Actinomycetota bacterium]